MLLPCTVTDAAPVRARLDRRSKLSPLPSADHAWLVLPLRDPNVMTIARLFLDPCPNLHLTDVSDSQLVPSHPVCPVRPLTVSHTIPMLLPCTVTDAEPVPARLDRRLRLSPLPSADHAWLVLPPLDRTEIATRRLSPDPCPTVHRTDVSDSQLVPLHPVYPIRPFSVSRTIPMLLPCTVTDAEPVPARFDCRVTLSPLPSADHVWLVLPPLDPTVMTKRRLSPDPCPTLHLTDVSDSQLVPSHLVCPVRPSAVSRTIPIPAPCTVTDAEPVPARFARRVRLIASTSTDHA